MDKIMPHKPTLGWAVAVLVIGFIIYHCTIGRRR